MKGKKSLLSTLNPPPDKSTTNAADLDALAEKIHQTGQKTARSERKLVDDDAPYKYSVEFPTWLMRSIEKTARAKGMTKKGVILSILLTHFERE